MGTFIGRNEIRIKMLLNYEYINRTISPKWNRELEIDGKNEFEAAKEKANEWEPSTNLQEEIVCSRFFCHAH